MKAKHHIISLIWESKICHKWSTKQQHIIDMEGRIVFAVGVGDREIVFGRCRLFKNGWVNACWGPTIQQKEPCLIFWLENDGKKNKIKWWKMKKKKKECVCTGGWEIVRTWCTSSWGQASSKYVGQASGLETQAGFLSYRLETNFLLLLRYTKAVLAFHLHLG